MEKEKPKNKIEKEVGRIPVSEIAEVVIRVDDFGDKLGVNIRKWLNTDTYKGFTKQGVRIPKEEFEKFKEIINSINLNEF
jgi:hypothetical protein